MSEHPNNLYVSCLLLAAWVMAAVVSPVHAQHRPHAYGGEVGMTAASDARQPLWLYANQRGLIEPTSANAYARVYAGGTLAERGRLRLSYGADLMARAATRSTVHFSEAFAQVQTGFLRVWGGRRHEVFGPDAEMLTSGALVIGENATPVTKLALETDGYLVVPYTEGWVQVRGSWAHGWLTGGRYVDRPMLHQKTAYLRLGRPEGVTLHAGIVHNALWGGTSSHPEIGRLPAGFDDYVRTVFVRGGAEDAPRVDRVYKQGNHIGVYDVALAVPFERVRLHVYLQHPFEDRSGMRLKNWRDELVGLSIARRQPGRFVDRLTYEFIHTKHQSGPVHPPGEDNYFNHATYRTGWTHHGLTIGTPLIYPHPDAERRRTLGIASNRLVGHHLGVAGHVRPGVRYRALATYTRNYGTYKRPFDAVHPQLSLLLEARAALADRVELRAAVGADAGSAYDERVGMRIGVAYRGGAR